MAIINGSIPMFWGWTAYTPVIPKLYWDVYSQEERIKRLCIEYDKLTKYASMIAEAVNELSDNVERMLADFEEKITKQIADQNEAVKKQLDAQNKKVDNELANLKIYIDKKLDDIAMGTLVYDVTTGAYRSSQESLRRLYQALSYANKGENELVSYNANKTVEDVATQTVYNLAYGNQPTIVINPQN